jgi:hypothetical protein
VLSFLIMVIQKSKPYYLAASFPVLMAAGGAAWEGWTDRRQWRWGRWFLMGLLLAGGIVYSPIALPLLPLDDAVLYMQRIGAVPKTAEVGHTSAAPQHFSDRFGWEELARTVANAYQHLTESERSRCVIVARNYGHAGALEYWSRRYDLPAVYCPHNNYWLWGPPASDGQVLIITGSGRDRLEELFEEVTVAGERVAPQALESHITVWNCRRLKRPLTEVWSELKTFI